MTITESNKFNPNEPTPEAADAAFFMQRKHEVALARQKIDAADDGDPRNIAADNSALIRRASSDVHNKLIDELNWQPDDYATVGENTYWLQPSRFKNHGPALAVLRGDGECFYLGIDGVPNDERAELLGMKVAGLKQQELLVKEADKILSHRSV